MIKLSHQPLCKGWWTPIKMVGRATAQTLINQEPLQLTNQTLLTLIAAVASVSMPMSTPVGVFGPKLSVLPTGPNASMRVM